MSLLLLLASRRAAPTFTPLDTAPLLWLSAAGLPESGAIATWADSSGNGNNATQAGASERPAVGTLNSNPAAVFGAGDYLQAPGITPTGATSAGRFTKTVVARLVAIVSTLNNLMSGADQHAMRIIDTSGVGRLRSLVGSGGNAINSPGPDLAINTTYLFTVAWAPDLGLHTLYVNGAWVANNVATGAAGGTTQNDATLLIGGFNGVGNLDGTIGEALLHGRLLTGAEQHALLAWASARYGLGLSALPLVVGIGGSWMLGQGVTGAGTTGGDTLLSQVFDLLNLTPSTDITAVNDGASGQSLATLLATQTVYSRYTAVSPRRVCVFWVTSNDLTSGESTATVLSRAETQARRLVATGYTVLILPILPRTSTNPAYETGRQTINAALATNATAWGAVYVDVFAGDADVLDDPANITNPTYWQNDEIHITAAAYALLAANVAPALATTLA